MEIIYVVLVVAAIPLVMLLLYLAVTVEDLVVRHRYARREEGLDRGVAGLRHVLRHSEAGRGPGHGHGGGSGEAHGHHGDHGFHDPHIPDSHLGL
jgi:hypothetical protein